MDTHTPRSDNINTLACLPPRSPYAPHVAEELWERLGHQQSLAYEPWPAFDPSLLQQDTVTLAVQVGGKVRGVRGG